MWIILTCSKLETILVAQPWESLQCDSLRVAAWSHHHIAAAKTSTVETPVSTTTTTATTTTSSASGWWDNHSLRF
jgi:hypothetical protein